MDYTKLKYEKTMKNENIYKIIDKKQLTETTFSLIFPKSKFKYKAGQHISITQKGEYNGREYSIYSGADSENLQVLIKEVKNGYFTPLIANYKIGQELEIIGPYGNFGIDENKIKTHKFYFIASGTGIAPFHSMVETYPELNYQLIHGVRYLSEQYEHEFYGDNYLSCVSRERGGFFFGRITSYLKTALFEDNALFYFCGNSDMIVDSVKILYDNGITRDRIFAEVYF